MPIVRIRKRDRVFKKIDPLNKLEEQLENIKTPKLEGLPEFNSGAVGFISYEAVSYFEPSINKIEDQTSYFPESIFFITSSLIVFDNEDNKLLMILYNYTLILKKFKFLNLS